MKKLLVTLLIIIPIYTFSFNSNSSDTIVSDIADITTLFDIRRNAVYNEDLLAFSYERLLPVSDKFGFLIKGGFIIWDPLIPLIEGGIISGKNKHFFEVGFGGLLANTSDEGYDFFTFRAGYRYQATKGFLFKISGIYSPDNFLLPLIAIGYAF